MKKDKKQMEDFDFHLFRIILFLLTSSILNI